MQPADLEGDGPVMTSVFEAAVAELDTRSAELAPMESVDRVEADESRTPRWMRKARGSFRSRGESDVDTVGWVRKKTTSSFKGKGAEGPQVLEGFSGKPARKDQEEPEPVFERKGCLAYLVGGHTLPEVARSAWFDTRALLVWRLAVAALLLGQLTFFSLGSEYSFRYFETWSFLGLSIAFVLTMVCSLCDVVGPEIDDDTLNARGVTHVLANIAAPLYQVFATAALYGTVVYWAAVYKRGVTILNYAVISRRSFTLAVVIIDMLLSMSIRFRISYIAFFCLYVVVYIAYMWIYFKKTGTIIYEFLEHVVSETSETVPTSKVVTAYVSAAAGAVAAGFIMFFFSRLGYIKAIRARAEITHANRKGPGPKQVDVEKGLSSSDDLNSSPRRRGRNSGTGSGSSVSASDLSELTGQSESMAGHADVRTHPISDGFVHTNSLSRALPESDSSQSPQSPEMSPPTHERVWKRVVSSKGLSQSSSGSEKAGGSRFPVGGRGSARKMKRADSTGWWDDLGEHHAEPPAEFFKMPAANGEEQSLVMLGLLSATPEPPRSFARTASDVVSNRLSRTPSGREPTSSGRFGRLSSGQSGGG